MPLDPNVYRTYDWAQMTQRIYRQEPSRHAFEDYPQEVRNADGTPCDCPQCTEDRRRRGISDPTRGSDIQAFMRMEARANEMGEKFRVSVAKSDRLNSELTALKKELEERKAADRIFVSFAEPIMDALYKHEEEELADRVSDILKSLEE